ncbi:ATPase inhibitor subunit zeta [Microvirga massiliensis]|uniref:ATPase inhibitor subunit zeta n=1 Tax=Microvirga massiliensis TaxID=1033741 RepID=UPI00062BDC30|nr:ATPase inhibitor subunit zeta [Microvirga massiliensis]
MTNSDDVVKTMLRNKLLGRWAAEKLGLAGREAEAYSDALVRATVDPERNDVFRTIRQDFDAAGVEESDEQIRCVMTELMLKAGNLMPTARGDSLDSAAVALARNLMSR